MCSGAGALDVACLTVFGGEIAWHADNDPSASAVLAARWPGVPNLGDITEVDWKAMVMAGNRKLTPEQVDSAVRMYRDLEMSLAPIAEYFGVTRQAMWDLLRRRTQMRPQARYGEANHFWRGGARADARAHDLTERAVLRGVLVRPERCEQCGGTGQPYSDGRHPIQAHHDDYNRPLDVRWLCQPCHHDWHRTNTAETVKGGDANGELADIDAISAGFP